VHVVMGHRVIVFAALQLVKSGQSTGDVEQSLILAIYKTRHVPSPCINRYNRFVC
jgi:hypothetical protein